jgi:very-short-patch-repair endonuclease
MMTSAQSNETPWERRRRLHSAQTRAVVRAYEGRVLASHHSALVLSNLPTFAADLRQVHVTRVDGPHSRRRPGLTIHRSAVEVRGAAGVINLGDGIVGTAKVNGEAAGLIAADAALNRGLITLDELADSATRITGPGAALARRVLAATDPRAESPGETQLRRALTLMGFAVRSQFTIEDGSFTAVVDFLLEEFGVAVEFDGFVKYGRRIPSPTEAAPGDIVFAEKLREDHIRGLGYGMARVVWHDLEDQMALRRRVERVIEMVHGRRRSA